MQNLPYLHYNQSKSQILPKAQTITYCTSFKPLQPSLVTSRETLKHQMIHEKVRKGVDKLARHFVVYSCWYLSLVMKHKYSFYKQL